MYVFCFFFQIIKQFERDDEKTYEMQMTARKVNEEIIKLLSPFLERTNPSIEICRFLSKVSKLIIHIEKTENINKSQFDCLFLLDII